MASVRKADSDGWILTDYDIYVKDYGDGYVGKTRVDVKRNEDWLYFAKGEENIYEENYSNQSLEDMFKKIDFIHDNYVPLEGVSFNGTFEDRGDYLKYTPSGADPNNPLAMYGYLFKSVYNNQDYKYHFYWKYFNFDVDDPKCRGVNLYKLHAEDADAANYCDSVLGTSSPRDLQKAEKELDDFASKYGPLLTSEYYSSKIYDLVPGAWTDIEGTILSVYTPSGANINDKNTLYVLSISRSDGGFDITIGDYRVTDVSNTVFQVIGNQAENFKNKRQSLPYMMQCVQFVESGGTLSDSESIMPAVWEGRTEDRK